ncbi:hypothetical protein UXU46_07830 [Campylobacter jejuni]
MTLDMHYNVFLLYLQDTINQVVFIILKLEFQRLQNENEVLSNLVFLKLQVPIKALMMSMINSFSSIG